MARTKNNRPASVVVGSRPGAEQKTLDKNLSATKHRTKKQARRRRAAQLRARVATVYGASTIKSSTTRATKAEMDERAEFLIAYAEEHGPITVRGLYYQAEVAQVPGIDKTENSYRKVQYQFLALRRAGRLSYDHIADATRWMRKPQSYDSIQAALAETARTYRRNLWRDADSYVEIWIEKDALAGVIYPVTELNDVPLMVTRGFSSETFAYNAVESRGDNWRDYHIYYFGDFDRSGQDAAWALQEKLQRFAKDKPFRIIFENVAVTTEQIQELRLPTRPHKRTSAADRRWPHSFACELDAIPLDTLRVLAQDVIERHLPPAQFETEKVAEESEREWGRAWTAALVSDDLFDEQSNNKGAE